MAWNHPQCAGAAKSAQAGHCAETAEDYHIGVFRLERVGVRNPAKKNAGPANPMTLLEKFLDQRHRFAGTAAPYNTLAVANDSGEIEMLKINFLWHFFSPTSYHSSPMASLQVSWRLEEFNRDRGEPHDSAPPTPPYVRFRIRRSAG